TKFVKKHRFLFLFPGLIALLVAIFSLRYSLFNLQLLGVQVFFAFQVQLMYWMVVSTACIIWLRPMVLPHKRYQLQSAAEAKTTTSILPGGMGRVQYEGCSWPAYCENCSEAIASGQTVYVLRQEGNTLVIAPHTLFQIDR
ncbi:MAG: NfeD family protein, partial [Cyanobacteriota bacterium]|nr:NfeD family protein [Cyanobacteriota bacterium]